MTTEHGETKPKTFSWVRVGLVVCFILAPLLGLEAWCKYSQRVAAEELTKKFRAESFAVLGNARGADELRDAVGERGYLFSSPQGEWVAIRYVDSHIWPGSWIAVSVDSRGNWWVSNEHYCGLFLSYRRQLERVANAKTDEEREYHADRVASFPLLTKLQNAPSLESSHETLRELGFRATSPP